MTLVVAIGGSLLAPAEVDPERYAAYVACVEGAPKPILVIVGGGAPARSAIQLARPFEVDEESLDEIGIAATRLNARTLEMVLAARGQDVYPGTPATLEGALAALDIHDIVVMGGTVPGQSTDAVAAGLAAHADHATLVIASNIDAIYTADPRKDATATPVDIMGHDELLAIVGDGWQQAGQAGAVDPVAAKILADHQVPLLYVDGQDPQNLADALSGRSFRGTRVGVLA